MTQRQMVQRMEADRQKLYAMARAMMGNEHDALDMVSEAAYKACRKAHTIKDEQATGAWLATVLVNCCRDGLRKRKGTVELDVDAIAVPDETAQVDTRQMVESLPSEYRAIVLMRFYGEMRPPEISKRLGMPQKTVRSRLNRALSLMKMQLEEE